MASQFRGGKLDALLCKTKNKRPRSVDGTQSVKLLPALANHIIVARKKAAFVIRPGPP